MKKILIPFLLFYTTTVFAQLNNSWIDYSKTYYKFKLGTTGLCRINQSDLMAIGLANTLAPAFQLWRNGQEVRLYTSKSTGVLGTADYIEFLGYSNDGIPDKRLYNNIAFQLCDKTSLYTDTAAYFLTVNSTANNLRYTQVVNNTAGNTLAPEPYFMNRLDHPFRDQINRGYYQNAGDPVYSSSYDIGEGWTSGEIYPTDIGLGWQFNNLNVSPVAPANSLSIFVAAVGCAVNSRNLKVKLLDSTIINAPMDSFNALVKQVDNLPLSILRNNNYAYFLINGNSTNVNDRVTVADVGMVYPSTFNFNNQKNYYFELQASSTPKYLEITNFNGGSIAPVLYDITTGQRYVADISTTGIIKFLLPASSSPSRQLMLVNEESSNITYINKLVTKSFVNFGVSANQGDYLIISHPSLYNNGSGVNYVDQYRQYRASLNGGSFNSKVISIDELTDQFAFGIKKHPSSIKDFIQYATQQFAVKPKYIFLIGRGISYPDYRYNESNSNADKLNLVPTFGWPASDALLSTDYGKYVPQVPIGRLSAITGDEVGNYLEKMIEYEQVQANPMQTINDKGWMKNFIHVIGGGNIWEDQSFKSYMAGCEAIAVDSAYGAKVETFKKESSEAVEQLNGDRIKALMEEGTSLIGYFGHSSANTLAFNLSDPEGYNNKGKYPLFNVSGCSAGNFFTFDQTRLAGTLSISEKYVLAKQRGSIAFLADTHLGIPPYLDMYNTQFYTLFSKTMYGNTVGNQLKQVLQNLGASINGTNNNNFFLRMHLEEILLNGDPAVKINYFALPDFAVEDPTVKINPSILSVADNSFTINIKMYNLGKVVNDSIRVTVKRKLPDGTIKTLIDKKIPTIRYIDSLNISVPINAVTDKGQNQLIVSLDEDNKFLEVSKTNNIVTKDFYIFEDELKPVYPYNYSIVNNSAITYSASTANPLLGQRQYLMEVDTTELFNSPFKKQYTATSIGGVIQFTPNNIAYSNNTVYYWRTAIVPLTTSNAPNWNIASFIYLPNSSTGFNQSHYYQHLHDTYTDISLTPDRVFKFNTVTDKIIVRTGLIPYYDFDAVDVTVNYTRVDYWGCTDSKNKLQIYVFDSLTHLPWKNYAVNSGSGQYGSLWPCSTVGYRNFFEFSYGDALQRKAAIDFLNTIPNGMYISITNFASDKTEYGLTKNTTFIDDWKLDAATLGAGNTLYDKLKSIGFTKIDSFTHNLPFLYFYRKGSVAYPSQQFIGATVDEHIEKTFYIDGAKMAGTIESPLYGPAKKWYSLHWSGKSVDPILKDSTSINVYGIKNDGTKVLLSTVHPATDTSLSFIDAALYPYVQLKMFNADSSYVTPNQLNYFRINADYLPEGAVAPNIAFNMKDTLGLGEKINFTLAFKNISNTAFDSLKIKFIITDNNNVPHTIAIPKAKILVAGDTILLQYTIDSKKYLGNNTLYVMFNPDKDQPEDYLNNNFIYKNFFVKDDVYNPLLDVTFDGVHILNKDIVAAHPNILINLKDESKYLALNDTSLATVTLSFLDQTNGWTKTYPYDGTILKFISPSDASKNNTAAIQFNPSNLADGEYQLVVSAKDRNGNKAGNSDYRIVFTVISKPMISNLLNYPNPFTSSTAFVFTITGSEPPQGMRIQILTITGKVVKEISKDELGPIHVGKNITDFKWDGTDNFGQKLANGVYLYRVLTNLNGKALDKYRVSDDNTDKYFNKGYGKMYLMR